VRPLEERSQKQDAQRELEEAQRQQPTDAEQRLHAAESVATAMPRPMSRPAQPS